MRNLTLEEIAAAAMIAQPNAAASPAERERFEKLREAATGKVTQGKNRGQQARTFGGYTMTAEQRNLARMIAGEEIEEGEEKTEEGNTYAFEFDGTLCENKYPDIGEAKSDAIEKAKELQAAGGIIILWTCREDTELQEAVEWCESQGLSFDYINQNINGEDCKKLSADFYIDEKNANISEL